MRKVVIASAVRTAGGKFGGSLKSFKAGDLGAIVIDEAVSRAKIEKNAVDQVIFGNGWQAGVGANPARISTVKSGLPVSVPAFTVNKRCGSSLRALQLGVLSIAAGESDIVVAGGTESASNVPYALPEARWGQRMGSKTVDDLLHKDGFICPLADMFMGDTCELLNQKYDISRTEQDIYALESQSKAIKAINNGLFDDEIVPIEVKSRKSTLIFKRDEVHRETNLEKLGKLPSVFTRGNTVTAGNSCALSDGASAVVIMSEEKAKALGIKPMAEVVSYSFVGLEPEFMGLGPAVATPVALKKAGLSLEDIDMIELNEAFAGQVLSCDKEMKMDMSKVNMYGGAIALGHPVAATGTKILTTLLYGLKRENKTYGLATLCVGGGQGVAMIVKNIK
ncbi:thiolase family protein [Acidaminobacter sp. JC074]|uniref:thiolase family protein n=1 Tax=Acidaminobacter sp. JC074 TaxID=2530199 RepID=UPI001F0F48CE|nr:thiolase family protein [Acidaminobacter sp. JC074]MCH4889017.1 thiolase family protein [Acidaminobacter sp. JC074]